MYLIISILVVSVLAVAAFKAGIVYAGMKSSESMALAIGKRTIEAPVYPVETEVQFSVSNISDQSIIFWDNVSWLIEEGHSVDIIEDGGYLAVVDGQTPQAWCLSIGENSNGGYSIRTWASSPSDIADEAAYRKEQAAA